MKYKETTNYSFFLGENHYVYDNIEEENSLHIYVKSKPHSCCCPKCGNESNELHSTYERILQDTPIHCKNTYLHSNVYKYNCTNPECNSKVFTEDLPFAKASQVRTDALNALILGVSMFMSNEGASNVLALLGVKISNDTIQRLYDRIEFVDNPDVEEIGVDDVAIRKGQKYATAIYDLKDHHLISLLEGRDGETLKEWLKNHKKVNLVARDRASAYASAINEILPDCIQVADRFHILQNLLNYLKDIFKETIPSKIYIQNDQVLDCAPKKVDKEKKIDEAHLSSLNYDNSPPLNDDGRELMYDNKKHLLTSKQYLKHAKNRKKKQQLINDVQAYWSQLDNKKFKILAEVFEISPQTAKKYVNMSEEDIKSLDSPTNYKKRDSLMNDWLNIIFKMMYDGHSNETIYYYILRQEGFKESKSKLEKYIYIIGKNNFSNRTPFNARYLTEQVLPPDTVVINRCNLLKYLLTCNPKVKKDEKIAAHINLIKDKYPAAIRVESIFKEFHSIIMGDDQNELDEFLDKYEDSEINSFCNGIKKDIAPVKNAISLSVSSGFVEGNNNKFKLIKRIVYGRSGLVNLAKKCKLAFNSKNDDFKLEDLI